MQLSNVRLQQEAFLKRYLEYARSQYTPKVSPQAGKTLAAEYVSLREEVRPRPPHLLQCVCAPCSSSASQPRSLNPPSSFAGSARCYALRPGKHAWDQLRCVNFQSSMDLR